MPTEPYPIQEPYKSGHLAVSAIHQIYYEESGNPQGLPIVHVHGGPGSKTKAANRSFYDPQKYRIILYDQRGCGLSTPAGETKENTTWDLVDDLHKLKSHLQITETWYVSGGSWGSTLALAYAQKYPEEVRYLFLRSLYTFTQAEEDWYFKFGANQFSPDSWAEFIETIGYQGEYGGALIDYLIEILATEDGAKRLTIASAIGKWERSIIKLVPDEIQPAASIQEMNSAQIFMHYVKHKGWLTERQLLNNMPRIQQIPGCIIHGRYDLLIPASIPWELHESWPLAELFLIPTAGHHNSDPGMTEKILEITAKI